MRTVVLGATGNVGSAVLRALIADPAIEQIVGFARRRPPIELPKVRWVTGDILEHDLTELVTGAAAVINLIWRIQPSRDRTLTRRVNIEGTARVLAAVAAARVPVLVHASSMAAYAPGPDDGARVDETWPTTGIASSFYSQDKADAERQLDAFEAAYPAVRVVRLRPGLIFQRSAAEQIRRYFLGPLWPSVLLRPGWIPLVPAPARLRLQVVHADDVAEAYRLAIVRPDARGAYNVVTEPPLTPRRLARVAGGVPVPIPHPLLRAVAAVTWRTRIQPTPPGWVDLARASPLLDAARLRALGWSPRHDAFDTTRELLDGLYRCATGALPPLSDEAGGRWRREEFRTGGGGGD